MSTVRNQLKDLYWKYLDGFQLLDGDTYLQGNFSNDHNNIKNNIESAVTTLNSITETVNQAPLFLDHLLDFQWLLHCQASKIQSSMSLIYFPTNYHVWNALDQNVIK